MERPECSSADGRHRLHEEPSDDYSRQHHVRASPHQRRILLLPLLLALGLFTVSSVCSKFLAPRAAGGRADDNDIRLSGRSPAGGASAQKASSDAPAAEGTEWDYSGDCTAGAPFALQGVDLVSYFSLAEGDEPVIGSGRYASTHGNYQFAFSSARNKALFEENPLTYLPAWGGFCAFGIPQEDNWSATKLGPPIDINTWAITSDGKFFFFRSERAKAAFLADSDSLIAAGESRWTAWFGFDATTYPFDVSCFCTLETC